MAASCAASPRPSPSGHQRGRRACLSALLSSRWRRVRLCGMTRDEGEGHESDLHHRRRVGDRTGGGATVRSEEHTSELQSLMRISYAVFCLKKKKTNNK